nr:MAG TPA: hypothetical protein [Caudoviricetes sp.]
MTIWGMWGPPPGGPPPLPLEVLEDICEFV